MNHDAALLELESHADYALIDMGIPATPELELELDGPTPRILVHLASTDIFAEPGFDSILRQTAPKLERMLRDDSPLAADYEIDVRG